MGFAVDPFSFSPGAGYDSAACAGSFEVLALLANKGAGLGRKGKEGTGRMWENPCDMRKIVRYS